MEMIANGTWKLWMRFIYFRLYFGLNYWWTMAHLDICKRNAAALEVDTSITGRRVAATLNKIAFFRGYPSEILTDNGPEFTSIAFGEWTYDKEIQHLFIDPGKPIQNAYIESFNGRFRDE